MFRIDKHLVQQHTQPADIPLIPVVMSFPTQTAEQADAEASDEEATLEETVAAANVEAANSNARGEAIIREAEQKARKILSDAEKQAKQQAEQQAAQILQQAEEQAKQQSESIRADAWQSGMEEGRHEARNQIRTEMEEWHFSAQKQLEELIEQIYKGREEIFANMEGEILDLALAIADKITNHTIKQDGDALTAMMQQALRQMGREVKITIQVNEELYNAFFKENSPNFILSNETLNVSIAGNPDLRSGDLLLESEDEIVNAGVESQLKQISLAFGRPWEPTL